MKWLASSPLCKSLALMAFLTTLPAMAETTFTRVSEKSDGSIGDADYLHFSKLNTFGANQFSTDGTLFVFTSSVSLIPEDTNGTLNAYLYDSSLDQLTMVDPPNIQAYRSSEHPVISFDGRHVAFATNKNLNLADTNGSYDIYIHDRQDDTYTPITSNLGLSDYIFTVVTMSGDSNILAFTGGPNYTFHIYNRSTDTLKELPFPLLYDLSDDGSTLVFTSYIDPITNTGGSEINLYIYDIINDAYSRIDQPLLSHATCNGLGNIGEYYPPAISGDGQQIAFTAECDWTDELSDQIDGTKPDVYLFNRTTNSVKLISNSSLNEGYSWGTAISADGNYIAYYSSEETLTSDFSDDLDFRRDLYVHDIQANRNYLVTKAPFNDGGADVGSGREPNPVISADGSHVAFSIKEGDVPQLYIATGYLPSGVNNAPVANAGIDQTIEATGNPYTSVNLDGSASSDLDSDSLSYMWEGFPAAPASGVTPSVDLPLGTNPITLTVSDGSDSDNDEVVITIEDTTPPSLTIPSDVTVPKTGELTIVSLGSASGSDLFGPVVIDNDAPESGFPLGVTNVTWTATDANKNTEEAVQKVTVVGDEYFFHGFYPPVSNLPAMNTISAGQVVPIKWSLELEGGVYERDISTVAMLTVISINCVDSTPLSEPAELSLGSLKYSDDGEQFVYNWKTQKAMSGICQRLTLTLGDGSSHSAIFQLR